MCSLWSKLSIDVPGPDLDDGLLIDFSSFVVLSLFLLGGAAFFCEDV